MPWLFSCSKVWFPRALELIIIIPSMQKIVECVLQTALSTLNNADCLAHP